MAGDKSGQRTAWKDVRPQVVTEEADLIGITRPNVSRLERGDPEGTSLGTLREYVEALGGRLRLVADFGDRRLRIQ